MDNKLQDDKKYIYADLILETTTDGDFNSVLKITSNKGYIVVLPLGQDEIVVKSTADE
jgi:hypothetical protein